MSLCFIRDGRYARNRTGCGRTRLAVSLLNKTSKYIYPDKDIDFLRHDYMVTMLLLSLVACFDAVLFVL